METTISKWGNSLALRLPKAFAEEIHLAADTKVDLSIQDGKLVVTPLVEDAPSLDELLAGITGDNLHGEVDFGAAVGNEVW